MWPWGGKEGRFIDRDGKPVAETRLSIPAIAWGYFFFAAFLAFFFAAIEITPDQVVLWISLAWIKP
jgi:hypothetical protein